MNILADILSATVLFAIPLLLVALGGMFSERSGVINIALEGIMVIGALISILLLRAFDMSGFGAAQPQLAVLIAILAAGLSGAVYSLLLAFASINLKADQTMPVALLLLLLSSFVIYKTKLGLRLRACGEHPQAADSVGVNVYRMRYIGVLFSGFLGGIGGLAFTLAAGSGFQSQVAGYGFLALAVMIFGNWKPLNILGAALFFAFFKIIGSYSGSIPFLPDFKQVRSSEYIYLMLPYIVTMIVLILTSKKSRAPKAEGIPYDKGAR